MSIGQGLVSESGYAFSRFAKEVPSLVLDETDLQSVFLHVVSILRIKASMADSTQHENTEMGNAADTKSTPRTDVDRLIENIQHSGDFPDEELADKIVKSEKDLRRNFRLRSD